MKRVLAFALGAFTIMAAAGPASARDGWSPGAALAVGAIGGLALGSAIGGAAATPYYPGKPVGFAAPPPRPVVVETVEEGPVCYVKRRRYIDEFGDEVVRGIRVCE